MKRVSELQLDNPLVPSPDAPYSKCNRSSGLSPSARFKPCAQRLMHISDRRASTVAMD